VCVRACAHLPAFAAVFLCVVCVLFQFACFLCSCLFFCLCASRSHRWFQESLPAYLSVSAEQMLEQANRVDAEIVEAVVKVWNECGVVMSECVGG
jgi:hypothetical protein